MRRNIFNDKEFHNITIYGIDIITDYLKSVGVNSIVVNHFWLIEIKNSDFDQQSIVSFDLDENKVIVHPFSIPHKGNGWISHFRELNDFILNDLTSLIREKRLKQLLSV